MLYFTEEQLQELSTIFGLKKVEDVLPVRDGFVTKETMVWWRRKDGPILVKAGDSVHWNNIKNYPHVYQLKQPNVRVEYED